MKKMTNILLLVAAASLAYQWRYKILNAFLGNESIRKMGVGMAMNMLGIRDRFTQSLSRK